MSKKTSFLMMALNATGVPLYLVLASGGWRNTAQDKLEPVLGEPFAWAICIPILLSLLLCDLVWGIVLARSRPFNGRGWIVCVASLIIAIVVDFSHH
jgi:hypothetical protein